MEILEIDESLATGVTTVKTSAGEFWFKVATAGAFVGDWELYGPNGYFRDGISSHDACIRKIEDMEN